MILPSRPEGAIPMMSAEEAARARRFKAIDKRYNALERRFEAMQARCMHAQARTRAATDRMEMHLRWAASIQDGRG